MRSKQYFTSIKNNPHEISTDPKSLEKYQDIFEIFVRMSFSFVQKEK